jgi:hypothetical protein
MVGKVIGEEALDQPRALFTHGLASLALFITAQASSPICSERQAGYPPAWFPHRPLQPLFLEMTERLLESSPPALHCRVPSIRIDSLCKFLNA